MSTLLFSLSLGQLATGTALMIIGSLAACLLTMSQWFIHRRAIATGFLVSVTILLSFYTWAFAITIIHSQAGIFTSFWLVCAGMPGFRSYRIRTNLPLCPTSFDDSFTFPITSSNKSGRGLGSFNGRSFFDLVAVRPSVAGVAATDARFKPVQC